jgi:hypothetical protein
MLFTRQVSTHPGAYRVNRRKDYQDSLVPGGYQGGKPPHNFPGSSWERGGNAEKEVCNAGSDWPPFLPQIVPGVGRGFVWYHEVWLSVGMTCFVHGLVSQNLDEAHLGGKGVSR